MVNHLQTAYKKEPEPKPEKKEKDEKAGMRYLDR